MQLGEKIRVLEEQNAKARAETQDVAALDRYLAKLSGLRQAVAKFPQLSQEGQVQSHHHHRTIASTAVAMITDVASPPTC
jgi:hypothetical protein